MSQNSEVEVNEISEEYVLYLYLQVCSGIFANFTQLETEMFCFSLQNNSSSDRLDVEFQQTFFFIYFRLTSNLFNT